MHKYILNAQKDIRADFPFSPVVVNCSGLLDPEFGAVTVTDTVFNSTATYSCSYGYNIAGNVIRMCLATGNWSGDSPACTGIATL